jgi:carboxyl-terminal processing protease
VKGDDRRPDRRLLFWTLALFFIFILVIGGLSFYVISGKELYYPFRLTSTLKLIKYIYPESFERENMLELAREAVLEQLDRYSGYLEAQELDRAVEEFSGSYGGIGITVVRHDCGLMVMSVRENSPAGKAGVRTGDIIIEADSVILAGFSTYKSSFLLRGDEGTEVHILVARNNMNDTLEFRLRREKIRLIHIPYAGFTENNNLYVRILDFEAGTAEELWKVLDTLYFNDRPEISGVILDVRGNPGGLLTEAVAVSDFFLDRGHLIVGIKARSRWQSREFFSTGRDILEGLPIAVLIDRGSASAAEILAGALKYAGRAVLVGDTTFGKGLVQEYNRLFDGSGIRLTTSRYYFEGNVFLNDPGASSPDSAVGISPDYYILPAEYEPFPMKLESSGLLRDFAMQHRQEIVAFAPFGPPASSLLDEFGEYAAIEDFDYRSSLTDLAEFIRDEVVYNDYSKAAYEVMDRIYRLSEENDRNQFQKYGQYIRLRLYQIALEAESGTARAYREIIVPYRPEINLAEKLLQEKVKNRH